MIGLADTDGGRPVNGEQAGQTTGFPKPVYVNFDHGDAVGEATDKRGLPSVHGPAKPETRGRSCQGVAAASSGRGT